jgi:hypothetical protein
MSAREQILARLNKANVTPQTVQPDVGGWYGSHQRGEDLPNAQPGCVRRWPPCGPRCTT